MARVFAALLVVCVVGPALGQKTPAPLKARLNVKVGAVSLADKKLPAVFTFTNTTEDAQKFDNGEYRVVLLDSKGELVENALLVPTVLRTVTLKGRSTADRPGLSLAPGKLKAGEEYYLVVSVRNLTALGKFTPKK
jgi:hypothetical protein